MPWIFLLIAGILEIGFAVALARSDGMSNPYWAVAFLAFAAGSFTLLTLAMREIPVGTAYAVWTGIGAAGTASIGMLALGDPANALRIGCIALIVIAVIGLQLTGSGGHG